MTGSSTGTGSAVLVDQTHVAVLAAQHVDVALVGVQLERAVDGAVGDLLARHRAGQLAHQAEVAGQRQSIVVDQAFDVTVNGKALDTLSGSGKAVANLALRLGLGQVLTNKVFSLFIGDEIDASLDQDRSENCATTMQAVKGWLSQIILISHKTMPADYCIDLEGAHGRIQ